VKPISSLECRIHARPGVGYPILFDWFHWFSWFIGSSNVDCMLPNLQSRDRDRGSLLVDS
jgi:hypothetical protein